MKTRLPVLALLWMILSGCPNGMADVAAYIATQTPSNSDGELYENTSISLHLELSTNGIRVSWNEKYAEEESRYWVARADGTYLDDYQIISGKFTPDVAEFMDTNIIHGKTYYYRIVTYHKVYGTDSEGHSITSEIYEITKAVSVDY